MWNGIFDRVLRRFIRFGTLIVRLPNGTIRHYGDGTGEPVDVTIRDKNTLRRLVLNPELAVGECYMSGGLVIEGDRIREFLGLVLCNIGSADRVFWQRAHLAVRSAFRRVMQNNVPYLARRNVAHHYDLSGELYDRFLDDDRQYSCAYFRDPLDSLEQAQAQKKAHIARKLLLEPGMRVLDIGCGWGGLALTLAKEHSVEVLGVTLSEEQLAVANRRAKEAGLSDRVRFRLMDYRAVEEQFDRIVSVGMFEHVGLPHFDAYFGSVRNRLADDGVALIHTIGYVNAPDATNPWIAKYIFPGSYVPSMSEVMASIEHEKLWVADIECWRLHYALTLHHWFDRFSANSSEIREIYGERFIRMWRFYLAVCEQNFRVGGQAVYQFQLSRKIDSVPITRDYLYQTKLSPGAKNPPNSRANNERPLCTSRTAASSQFIKGG